MAGPRRPSPPPSPPPRRAVVVDGANVIASSRRRPLERLALAERWSAAWRPDLPVWVFLDYSTAVTCPRDAQQVLRARCQDVTEGRPRYVVTPHRESADAYLLDHARAQDGLVLSNDRFWDHEERRDGVVTLQFHLKGDDLRVYDEATWFCGGGATRVPLAALSRG
ncbi:MAG: NYN domain-containing protein [Planctomycetota bacterium]